MDSLFSRNAEENPVRRAVPNLDASKPVPLGLAFALSAPNRPRGNRALRRKGFAYIWAPAAYPSRRTVSRCCNRIRFTSAAGTCRPCFLSGEGPTDEVDF